jgi:hypothetical protein
MRTITNLIFLMLVTLNTARTMVAVNPRLTIPCYESGAFDGSDVTIITSSPYTLLTCDNEFNRFCSSSGITCKICQATMTNSKSCIDFKFYCDGYKYKGKYCAQPSTTTRTTPTTSTSTISASSKASKPYVWFNAYYVLILSTAFFF